MSILTVIILGIVEGLTEFLPVSSTGHLIIAGHLLGFTGEKANTFEIFIQLGAILAVAWEFRAPIAHLIRSARVERASRDFLLNVALAFVPAAVVGLLLGSRIKALLFNPPSVAAALIGGGILMWILETVLPPRSPAQVFDTSRRQALWIGTAQVCALVPGVSRSASTILGGMIVGLDRHAATEFSFYLALPTLGAATIYDLLKNLEHLDAGDVFPFSLGLIVSFVCALIVIRVFLRYVRTHDFKPMALYRMILGIAVFVVMSR